MTIRKGIILILFLFLVTGCADKEQRVLIQNDTHVNEEEIEETIRKDERITNAFVLIHEKELIIAMNLKTFSRFKKDKIEKSIEKKIAKDYEEFDVTVSADMKIIQEVKKIMELEQTELVEGKIKKLKLLKEEET